MFKNSSKLSSLLIAITIIAGGLSFASIAHNVYAQTTQTVTQPQNGDAGGFVPCGNDANNPCQIGHLFAAFVVIVNYLIGMAGFIAVLAIVYAGFMMVYSQGQEQLKAAKGRFAGAVIGLVLVAAAFVLVNTLFASGNLGLGVQNGGNVLAHPLDYIESK